MVMYFIVNNVSFAIIHVTQAYNICLNRLT